MRQGYGIDMSAFLGTPLGTVLRDCGISAFAIAGVAMEVGIQPTVRHGTDLGYLSVVIEDACGAGNAAAAGRSLAALRYAGNVLISASAAFRATLQPRSATNCRPAEDAAVGTDAR
jgi:nicotinamidase-related amidase